MSENNPVSHVYHWLCGLANGCIDILAPDGTHLDSIGHIIKQAETETAAARLKEYIFLIECLLSNINHDIKLPAQAVAELADLFYRMQNVCGKYLK